MTWVAAVDYRRGRAHTSRELPCQDYGKIEKVADDIMVGAVADGAGIASLSHVGAKIAVRAATAGLKNSVDRLREVVSAPSEPAARELFVGVLDSVQTALRSAAAQHLVRVGELASTLLVFAAGPGGLAAVQIGHGFIVYRVRGGAYELVFQPGDMSFAQPGLVTGPRATEEMRVGVRPGPVEFLCAATDGLQPLSIHHADWTPHETFFRKLDRYSAAAGDDGEIHRGIREFLRSDGLNDRVEDDTTLMLCSYRPRSGWSDALRA